MEWGKVAENLRVAGRYIEEHGWYRGGSTSDNGSVCARFALQRVKGIFLREDTTDEARCLLSILGEYYKGYAVPSIPYNDYHIEDQEAMVRMFEKAAVRAEEMI